MELEGKRLVFVGEKETLAQNCRMRGERFLLVKSRGSV